MLDLIVKIAKEPDLGNDIEYHAGFIYDYLYKNVLKKFDEIASFKNL